MPEILTGLAVGAVALIAGAVAFAVLYWACRRWLDRQLGYRGNRAA